MNIREGPTPSSEPYEFKMTVHDDKLFFQLPKDGTVWKEASLQWNDTTLEVQFDSDNTGWVISPPEDKNTAYVRFFHPTRGTSKAILYC